MTLQSIRLGQWRRYDSRTEDISSVEGADGVTDVVMIIVSRLLVVGTPAAMLIEKELMQIFIGID
jgi:hypothetical protein